MTDFVHGERERGLARLAYQTFEPLHLLAYFGPHVDAARERIGAGWLSSYAGMRAAPLGPVPSSVVAATFFGFNPAAIDRAWVRVLTTHSTAELNAIRTEVVNAGLRAALGDLVASPGLARLTDRLLGVVAAADFGARPLAAAYAALPRPQMAHLALWHAATLWREWRGDGHNAVLLAHGIEPLQALVLMDAGLHEAPARHAVGRDRAALQPSRRWTDEEWVAAAQSLAIRRLVTVADDATVLTEAGAALRQRVEDMTDDAAAAVWVGVEDAEDLVASFRPFSKAVISAGILPGTKR